MIRRPAAVPWVLPRCCGRVAACVQWTMPPAIPEGAHLVRDMRSGEPRPERTALQRHIYPLCLPEVLALTLRFPMYYQLSQDRNVECGEIYFGNRIPPIVNAYNPAYCLAK